MKHVLLIDDDETFQYLFGRVCKSIAEVGELRFASNGSEGLEFLTSRLKGDIPLPNFIFLDINMPVMNGHEFVVEYKKLKAAYLDKLSSIIVGVLTSSNQESDRKKLLESGVVAKVISKPDSKAHLKEIIENALQ